MNTKVLRIITIFAAFTLALGTYMPGRATSETALTPAQTVNIAYFYKPPNMDAASAAKNFSTMILTNGDSTYRDQLKSNGFSSTIPEYFRSEAIQDPGSCTATPLNNQVAYEPGDFCFISQNHPDWFLLDRSGRRLTVTDSRNYYRMDPGNPGWRDFFVSRVVESQNQNGWSALFLDNVEASLGKFFGNNPAKYPDEASYEAAVAGFLQYLDVNYSQKYGRPFFGNIIVLGSDDVWFHYLQYLDGALTERFAVNWDETSYLRADKWEDDMALIEKTQAQGKYVILVSPGYQTDLNRENFAFASYLLVSNGKAAFRYAKFSAYRQAWLYDNYKVNLGSPLGGRYLSGNLWRRDFTNGYVVVDPNAHTAFISEVPKDSDIRISVGGMVLGGYDVPSNDTLARSYPGVLNGPVRVVSTKGTALFASERVHNARGFVNEIAGIPNSQLTQQYWFPWYDNQTMQSWILVGNPSSSATAHVTIYIAGDNMGSYTIPPGGRVTPQYDVLNGPVHVVSDINVFTSERVHTGQGFVNEAAGIPNDQLTQQYWFPWYDNQTMQSWVLVGNPSSSATAHVTIYIAGDNMGSYTIPPGGRVTPQYDVLNGPVHVVSDINVFASERVHTRQGFVNEIAGIPNSQLTQQYWFPWYDNQTIQSWVLVGNPSSSATAHVTIYVAGDNMGSYTIPPGGRVTPQYNVLNGPVHVVSDINVFASERVHTGQGFVNEAAGIPNNQLDTEYWFPWYDNLSMTSYILVGKP